MKELQIFKNDEFGEIRTVQLNNETYFVGKDVAESLGYSNTKDALISHVAEEDKPMYFDSNNNKTFIFFDEKEVGKPIDTIIYPQIEVGTMPTIYEQYKTSQELTIPISNGLPGIKVNSGGNYTDETGQQWICDEIDFKRGKYVQRVNKIRLTSKRDWQTYFAEGINQFYCSIEECKNEKKEVISNYFKEIHINDRNGNFNTIYMWLKGVAVNTEDFSTFEEL